jgi:hypothetical protein
MGMLATPSQTGFTKARQSPESYSHEGQAVQLAKLTLSPK